MVRLCAVVPRFILCESWKFFFNFFKSTTPAFGLRVLHVLCPVLRSLGAKKLILSLRTLPPCCWDPCLVSYNGREWDNILNMWEKSEIEYLLIVRMFLSVETPNGLNWKSWWLQMWRGWREGLEVKGPFYPVSDWVSALMPGNSQPPGTPRGSTTLATPCLVPALVWYISTQTRTC